MRITSPSTPKQFWSFISPEKFFIVILAFLLGFSGSLSASTGPVNKDKNKPKTPAITKLKKPDLMGLPTVSYASPQTYVAGTAITPLVPGGSGAAAPGYSSTTTALGSGFNAPEGVAVDSKGNVYVGDTNNNEVREIPGGTGTPVVIGTGFSSPEGVAVDALGNVYVADLGNKLIKEIPVGGGAVITLGASFTFLQPVGVAVDTKGNVYVADHGYSTIEEIPAGGGTVITIGSGFSGPWGVAVDAYGNVYLGDPGFDEVKEIPAGNGAPFTLGGGFNSPYGVAVDDSGNVFVADYGNKAVKEIPVNGGAILTVGSGYSNLFGVATDNANNIYVADFVLNKVFTVQPTGGYYISQALPLGLSFNNTTGAISGTPVAVSPATTYTITAYNASGSIAATVNIAVNEVTISYAGPQTYVTGTAITPLAPTGTGAATPAYSSSTTTLGSGFSQPFGIAVDPKGNVYFGDRGNNQVKEIPGGTGTPVVIGSGFSQPEGVAVDILGNVYLVDFGHLQIKEVPLVNGTYGTPVVLGGSFSFPQPEGIAVDTKGNVYVADAELTKIEEIPVGGGTVIDLGSGFNEPVGVAVDAYGNVYVADYSNHAIKEIPAGNGSPVITLATGLGQPYTVAVDGSGNVFVADFSNDAVKEIPVNGWPIMTVGSGFGGPVGVAADAYDNVYVTDFNANAVKKVTPTGGYYISPELPLGLSFNNTTGAISGIPAAASPTTAYTVTAYNQTGSNSTTVNITVNAAAMHYAGPRTYLVGTAITPLAPTGGGAAAPGFSSSTTLGSGFNNPTGVAADAAGNIYVADYRNNLVKKIPVGGGAIVTLGTGFSFPYGVAVDAAGDVYVADYGGSAVYKIPGGSGTPVKIGTGFNGPTGVAVDAAGDVYVADYGASAVYKIPAGSNTPQAIGTGFNTPVGVAVDAQGNVYVGDRGSNAVKEIPAGSNTPQIIGSGFSGPAGVAVDASGNVYVGDYNNNSVKMIPVGNGNPVTIGGTGFSSPNGVGVDGAGNVYVADYGNNAVKRTKPVGGYYIRPFLPSGLSFNNTTGTISGTPAKASAPTNYTVTAYNQTGSNTAVVNIVVTYNSYLSALTVSTGALSPAFAPGILTYTLNVADGTPSITLTPTAAYLEAAIVVGGAPVISGTASINLPLSAGLLNERVILIADQNTYSTYNVIVSTASTNASLSNLKTSAGRLLPAFATTASGYTESVANSVSSITLTPYAASSTATMKVNGTTVTSGTASGAIALAVGPNTISTVVTSHDGAFTQTYTTVVTRAAPGASAIASLSNLKPGTGSLLPAFATSTTSYTESVANSVATITFTPFTTDATATVAVNGAAVTSGAASGPITLAPGAQTLITTVVTAGDGVTTKTYTVTITRASSSDANLSALELNTPSSLNPAFAIATTSYAVTVTGTATTIRVKPIVDQANTTLTVNGQVLASGAISQAFAISQVPITITIVVTAQDGVTTKTYTVTVKRAPSSNANLSSLGQSVGGLTPAFGATTTSYTENVSNATATMTLKPVSSDANATIKVNGTTVASGTITAPIALAVGANTITTVVTAQDGTTTKTYALMVTRASSTTVALSDITLSSGTLSPAFAGPTTGYAASVANSVATITVTPTTTVANSTITVNGTAVTSGTASGPVTLAEGTKTTISVVITAQNGTTKETYTVTVTRAPSANANLSTLGQSVGGLTPAFSSLTTSYTENVSNATASITLKPVSGDANATIQVNGTAVTSGTITAPIALAVGANAITAVVTAQNGTTTKTYALTVTRAAAGADSYVLITIGTDISVTKPTETPAFADDGIMVHQGVSPNGDGINDFLQIDNISRYPDNKLSIMNRNGQLIYEARGYDNSSKVFDGHSNKNGQMQLPGTYFYQLDYTVNGITKHKTGFIVLKY